jgi:hypothetical protein
MHDSGIRFGQERFYLHLASFKPQKYNSAKEFVYKYGSNMSGLRNNR